MQENAAIIDELFPPSRGNAIVISCCFNLDSELGIDDPASEMMLNSGRENMELPRCAFGQALCVLPDR